MFASKLIRLAAVSAVLAMIPSKVDAKNYNCRHLSCTAHVRTNTSQPPSKGEVDALVQPFVYPKDRDAWNANYDSEGLSKLKGDKVEGGINEYKFDMELGRAGTYGFRWDGQNFVLEPSWTDRIGFPESEIWPKIKLDYCTKLGDAVSCGDWGPYHESLRQIRRASPHFV